MLTRFYRQSDGPEEEEGGYCFPCWTERRADRAWEESDGVVGMCVGRSSGKSNPPFYRGIYLCDTIAAFAKAPGSSSQAGS